ncbi:DUF296 domain-containing protein [Rhodovulum sp. 12E13]|uniref:PCC domain-containing protein n=1 Tax=Rhodovulum sp. 12E13 TaxID=2203891 RepID=UPI000E12DD9A|nr:DUF296 domain-containing protein [Rhodovulum sp. 12E13]RDC69894.1 DUF296 domain-containing protein [Rhodovulum sp. 12E13]
MPAAEPAAATRPLALRLRPRDDLRAAIERAFDAASERAGILAAALGSLACARLRPAGRDAALEVTGPLEIVALSGPPCRAICV